jgi:general secretion pathway protein A
MYLQFYGITENPFNLVSDPRFFYYSESHCEAMSHLLYGVRERKGIVLMLGEAGTGKTTLIRATLEVLRSTRVMASMIMNPLMSSTEEFFEALLRGFGLDGFKRSNMEMMEVVQRFALQQVRRGMIPVVVVDEAQELSQTLLGQIRLLSNLEADGAKLLQFVFAAQPEMQERLDTYEMRALRQRVSVRCRLDVLGPSDTWNYIYGRLKKAGNDGPMVFGPEAVEMIYTYSGGIPRLINMIADNSLLAGYARSEFPVRPETIESVCLHLELRPANVMKNETSQVRQDILRACSSWDEVRNDIQAGEVPQVLKDFASKLQLPRTEASIATAVGRKE